MYGGRVLSFLGGRNDEKFQVGIVRSTTCFWLAVLQEDPRAIRAMDHYGWESLVGVKASIERRSANSVFIGGGAAMETTQPSMQTE